MIWDLHCRLSGAERRMPHERVARRIDIADRVGIKRSCFSMGMEWSRSPAAADLRNRNDQVLETLEHHHDRAFGFCYVSGDYVDVRLAESERTIVRGPKTRTKLWPARRESNPAIDPITRRVGDPVENAERLFQP